MSKREFTPEVVNQVWGGECDRRRTPMHIMPPAAETPIEPGEQIDPSDPETLKRLVESMAELDTTTLSDEEKAPEIIPARELLLSETSDPELFNAIGSRAIGGGGHIPLLDVDGGVYVSKRMGGRKAVLFTSHEGAFSAKSDLPDILDEYHGINMSVREVQRLGHRGSISGERELSGNLVASVILKARDERTFAEFASSTPGHRHLYIQRLFTDEDYSELVSTFTKMGILSDRWEEIVTTQGQGILRTPWTQKPADAYGS